MDNSSNIPTDRQLALRAKLKIGWSTGRPDVPLSPKEQEAIKNVIRRNELLEMAERQRVGKLVERVENIKSRAADTGPKNCRMCGQAFGLLVGPSKLICDDCRKPVCSKCCIDLNSRSPTKRVLWLCKICSETRELWKKTGAWFYKGIPSYDLPQHTNSKNSNSRKLSKAVSEEASSDKVPKITKLGMQQSSSEEEEETEPISSRLSSKYGKNFFGLKLPNGNASRSLDEAKKSPVSPYSRQTSSSESQRSCSYSQIDWETMSRNRSGSTAMSTTNLRRGSVSSSFSMSESSSGNDSAIGCLNPVYRDPVLGWLEISISYDESRHCLDCSILRARDLPPMDTQCLADPFCKANVITGDSKFKYAKWMKTKVAHKTINPEFNETFSFIGMEPEELADSILYVVVFDDDKYGHDFLGACKFSLVTINLTNPTPSRMSISLAPDEVFGKQAELSEIWPNGKILISLCYNTKRRALVVLIKKCENLLPMDNNGFSDPFVKVHIKPELHRKKYKTSVKWRTLNPEYNEEFYFETRPNEMDKQSLYITVWDKDIGKSNDFLGSLIIGYNSKGRRLQQWRDCVRLPDHYHEQWHCLSHEHPGHQH